MRRNFAAPACFVLAVLFITVSSPKTFGQEVTVSYQTFYDELSPYGQWVDDPEYGNVWVPNVEPGYRPYGTAGHWVITENGNMWVSDQPWGWAAYHYGRWTFNSYYGWVWIPGYEWAPAWVSWRSGGGYYGWAPMGPGYMAGSVYDYPDNYWVFVGPQYLYNPNVYTYYEPRNQVVYIRQTRYINETYVDRGTRTTYYYGPRREAIERETHQPVQVYHVSRAGGPGATRVGHRDVSIYRPEVNRSTVRSAHPASVVKAERPVGKPENFSGEHRQPEFRQTIQQQNRTNTPGRSDRRDPQPMQQQNVNPQTRMQQQNTQPVHTRQQNEPMHIQPRQPVSTQQNAQPMHPREQTNEPARMEPQYNQPVRSQPNNQFEQNPRPARQQNMYEQPSRPQPQMNQQPARSQPQMNPQPARPQPQMNPQPARQQPQPAPQPARSQPQQDQQGGMRRR